MLTGLLRIDDTPVRQKAIVDIFNEILKGNNTLYGSLDEAPKDSMGNLWSSLLYLCDTNHRDVL